MLCTIWHHLYSSKIMKNTHGVLLLLVYVTLLRGCFSRFLNCTNGTKSRNASQMNIRMFRKCSLSHHFFFECPLLILLQTSENFSYFDVFGEIK